MSRRELAMLLLAFTLVTIALATIPAQTAADDAISSGPLAVTLDGPASALVGESTRYLVHATISGVQILSFPANATVTAPDGTVSPLAVHQGADGVYGLELYAVNEGIYTIRVTVPLDTMTADAQLSVAIRKPGFRTDITATRTNSTISGSVSQESAGDYTLDVAPLRTGALSTLPFVPVCTFSCATSCTYSCNLSSALADNDVIVAHFTTRRAFAYDQYLILGSSPWTQDTASVETQSGVGEPVDISIERPVEAFALLLGTLSPIPIVDGAYRYIPLATGTSTVILKDGSAVKSFPLTVIERTNVITTSFENASDGTNGYWLGYVRTDKDSLLKLPASVSKDARDASLLTNGQRTPLTWTKEYVDVPANVSGFIEVRRGVPVAAARTITTTGYGSRIGGSGVLRFETEGRLRAFDAALEELPAYVHIENGTTTTTVYTHDQTVALVPHDGGALTFSEPVKEGTPVTVRFDTSVSGEQAQTDAIDGNGADTNATTAAASSDTTLSIYRLDGTLALRQTFAGTRGERTFPLELPPGQYLAIADGAGRAAGTLRVYSENASLILDGPQTVNATEGTNVSITHTITNGDLANPHLVQLVLNSTVPLRVNYNDSDSDGNPDVLLSPGATARVTIDAFLPLGRTAVTVEMDANADALAASVTDSIIVNAMAVAPVTDADVVSIDGTEHEPSTTIYSRATIELPVTLTITGPDRTTEQNVTLVPGSNTIPLPDVGDVVTVHASMVGDIDPTNDFRTHQFALVPGSLEVAVQERQHHDHERYTLRTPIVPGYTLAFIGNDTTHETTLPAGMIDGNQMLWDLGPLAANSEFIATFVPGMATPVNLTTAIDNDNPFVVRRGTWVGASTIPGYIGFDYLIDLNIDKSGTVTYAPRLPHDRYEISTHTPRDPSLATDATIIVHSTSGPSTFTYNQLQAGWQFVGLYDLDPESTVVLANYDTTTFVVADTVSFTPISQDGALFTAANVTIESLIPNTTLGNVTDQGTNTSVVGPVVIGQPVSWTAVIPVSADSDTLSIAMPADVLDLNVTAHTDSDSIAIDTASVQTTVDEHTELATDALLSNAESDAARTATLTAGETDPEAVASRNTANSTLARAQQRAKRAHDVRGTRVQPTSANDNITNTTQHHTVRITKTPQGVTTPQPEAVFDLPTLPPGTRSVTVNYTTEAPQLVAANAGRGKTAITVTSQTHYENISAFLDIVPTHPGVATLYRTTDGIRERVPIQEFDTNGDGLIDRLTWVVPHLSNQTYELSLDILNPLAYLRDGDTWTVLFNTSGTGTLRITSPNSHWQELLADNAGTQDEMRFLNATCGGTSILDQLQVEDNAGTLHPYTSLTASDSIAPAAFVIENYSCADTGTFSDYMNKAGYAVLNFTFSDSFISQSELAVDPSVVAMLLFWDGSSNAPTNWTCVSCVATDAFYNKYPRGFSVYGGTGGAATHTHVISYVSETAASATTGRTQATASGASSGHTHGGFSSSQVSTSSNFPATRSLKMIAFNGTPTILPAGVIAIFNSSSLPSGWTRYSAEDAEIVSSNATQNVSYGNDVHQTDFNFTLSASAGTNNRRTTGGQVNIAASGHTHTGTDTTGSLSSLPPYRDVVLAEATVNTTIPVGSGFIAMFNGTVPTNWTNVSQPGQDFYQNFFRGASSYGGTGGAENETPPNQVTTTGPPSTTTTTNNAQTSFTTSAHTHDVTVSFNQVSLLPPYRDVVLGYAKDTIPPNLYNVGFSFVNGANLTRGVPQYAWVNVTDNAYVGSSYREHNGTGTFTNYTLALNSSLSSQIANHTLDFTNATEWPDRGPIQIRSLSGLDKDGNVNTTYTYWNFSLYDVANVSITATPANVTVIGTNASIACRVQDSFTGNNVSGYLVNLSSNVSGFIGTYVTNGSGLINVSVNISDTMTVTCAIGDNTTQYLYGGVNVSYNITGNHAPTQGTPYLNSTSYPDNLTTGNLTLWNVSTYDADGQTVKNINVWYLNTTAYPVMQLPFAPGSSNSTFTRDYAGLSNGTVSNAVYNATGGADGFGSYIFKSASANNQIVFGYSNRSNITKPPISVTAWVRLNSIGLDQKVVSKRPSWVLAVFSDNQVEFEMFNGGTSSLTLGGNFRTLPGTALAAGQWYYIAGTWDGSVMRTYVNGNLDATQNYAVASVDTTNFNVTIGRTADALANWFDGQIADVRVYDRNLTTGQLAQIYKEGQTVATQARMVSDQLRSQDNWSACITPDDGIVDGATTCTNNVFVNGVIAPYNVTNGTAVDRDNVSGGADKNWIVLNVTTYPDPNLAYTMYMNLSDPSIPGQSNIIIKTGTTDSIGYSGVNFTPNATTYAGNYTWWATSPKAATVGKAYFIVKGGLNLTYTNASANPNANYTLNESVTTQFNLTTYGASGLETRDNLSALYGAGVTSNLTNTTGSIDSRVTSYTSPLWNTTHSLLTLKGVGVWNASGNASAKYFYTPAKANRTFTVYSFMNVTANATLPSSIFSYQNVTTFCNVTDQVSQYPVNGALVSFYRNGTFLGSNTTNASGNTQLTYNVNVSGTYSIICNISNQTGIFYFAGGQAYQNNTLTVLPYPITPVNPANDTIIDRDGVQLIDAQVIKLNVSIPGYVSGNVSVNFTANLTYPLGIAGTTMVQLGSNTSNNSYAVLWYNPPSTMYAGNWTWWAENLSASTNGTKTFTVKGALNITYRNGTGNILNPNSAYNNTDTATIEVNVSSFGPETAAQLNTTYNVSVYNNISNTSGITNRVQLTYVNPQWNTSQSISSLGGLGTWNTNASVNGSFFYTNVTNRTFSVFGIMNVSANATIPSSVFTYQNTTSFCNVTDQASQYPVSGALVSFYRNGTFLGTNTTNTTGTTTISYNINTTGTWSIMCNITNQSGIFYYTGGQSYQNSTVTVLPYPIVPLKPVNGTIIDRDGVDPTDPDIIELNVSVPNYVADGVSVNFTANLSNPVGIAGTTSFFLGSNTTLSGYAVLWYNATNASYAGNWTWWAENTSGGSINNTLAFISKGALNITYRNGSSNILNPNSSYNQTSTAQIDVNVTSYGPETNAQLNNTYTISVYNNISNTSGITNQITLVDGPNSYWNGTQTLSNLKGVGVWNTNASTNGSFFYSNISSRTFTVYSLMNVSSNATNPSSVFAYQNTTTICNVTDQFSQYPVNGATVSFYRNGTFLGLNTTNSTGTAVLNYNVNVSGTYSIMCNITNQSGIFYYTGGQTYQNSTLTVLPFPVNALNPTNGTVVDRDSYDAIDPDIIELNVSVPNYVADGVSVNFTANLSNPAGIAGTTSIFLGSNTTLSGYAVLWYNPTAAMYAGNWTWWAENASSAGVNTTRNIVIKGEANASYESATLNPNSTYYLNDTVNLSANMTSNGPEGANALNASYLFSVNNTFQNTTLSSSSVGLVYNGSQWRNTTFTLLTLKGVGLWNTTLNASGTYFYSNWTRRTFTVYGFMNVTSNNTLPASMSVYNTAITTCNVTDQHTGYPVNGATVTFYRNGTFLGSNTTNSTGTTTLSYSVNTTGVWNIMCNVTDQLSIFYFAGGQRFQNNTLTVTPYPIVPVNPANGTIIDRDGVDPTDADIIELNVSVPNYVPDNVSVNFTANLSNPAGIAGTTNVFLGSNYTNGSYAVLWYNATNASYAGNWTWWAENATGATVNNTRYFISKGALNITYRNGSSNILNPNASYNQTDIAQIDVNVTSYGVETNAQLNNTYTISVYNNISNTSGNTNQITLVDGPNSYWNGTQNINTLKGVGLWTTNASVNSSFFYTNVTNRTFTVFGFMNVTSNATTPSTMFAYQNATTLCNVSDQLSGSPVNGVSVTFYKNGTFLGVNTTNSTGTAVLNYNVNVSGTYSIMCNITNQSAIFYYAGGQTYQNSTLIVQPYPITPVNPTNSTIVDRDSMNAVDADAIMLNVSIPPYVTSNVSVNFTANLTNPAGIAGTTMLQLGSNTSNNSYAVLWYNPTNATYAGNWTWWAENLSASTNGTMTFISKGALNITYRNATPNTVNPNSSYNQTDTAQIDVNVSSYGVETNAILNNTYNITVYNNITNTSGVINSIALIDGPNSYWNGTQNVNSLKGVGIWSTNASTNGSFFYTNVSSRTFTVYGLMNVTDNATSPSSIFTYQNTTTTCNVTDQFTQFPVNNALVSFYRNGTFLGTNTTNSTGTTTISYNINVSGTWSIMCNITNQSAIFYYTGGQTYHNSTISVLPFPITAINPVNGTVVDRDSADPTDADIIELNVSVPSYVPDNVSVNFTANLTTPSGIAGTTNVFLGSNYTNGSYAVLWYNPSSATYAGNWTWWAENTTSATANNTRIYTSKGALNTTYRNVTFSPNSSYNQTDTARIEANVSSIGPETRDQLNSSYNLTVTSVIANTSRSTTSALASYNTSQYWLASNTLSTLYGVGTWNSTVNSSGTFWYSNWTNRTFTLYGFMNVTGNGTTPSSIFTYQATTTSCNVTDQLSQFPVNAASVSFYRNGTFLGANTTNATGTAMLSYNVNVTGIWTITCNVSDQPGIFYYRGSAPEQNGTLNVSSFPISIVGPANNTALDRDGVSAVDADLVFVNASVPGFIPDGVAIDILGNLTTPNNIGGQTNVLFGTNTTLGGNAVLWWNPNGAVYAGNWTLFGNNSGGYANSTRYVYVIGGVNISSNAGEPGASVFQNASVTTSANVTTFLGPENSTHFNSSYTTNVTLQYQNTTGSNSSVGLVFNGSQWRNTTFTPLTLKGPGVWNFSIRANDSYHYANSTNRTLIVYGYMNVTGNSTLPASMYVYDTASTICNVTDQHTGYPVTGATVTFYRNGTFLGTNTTNSTGTTTLSYSVNTTGVWSVMCNVTDQPGIYYFAGDQRFQNGTLTTLPYPINAVNPVNGTIVDRDGADPIDPDLIELNVSVPAYVPDGTSLNFTGNLTTPGGIASTTNVFLGSNTTLGGYAVLWYNPTSATYAGNWTWWAENATGGTVNTTRIYTSKGALNTTYRNTSVTPNGAYNQTDTARVELNVSSLGPETRDQLNSSYTLTITSTIQNTTGNSISSLASYNTSQYWNASHTLSTLFGVGTWNSSINSSGPFWYSNTTNKTFTLYGFMNVTSNTTSPTTVFAFQNTTTICGIQDQLSGYPVVGASVGFYRNGTFLGTNTTDATGQSAITYNTNTTGLWTITCNVTDQPGIFYYRGNAPEANTTVNVVPFAITPLSPANGTIVDRDSVDGPTPDIITFNMSVPSFIPNGIMINVSANLTNPSIAGQTNVLFANNTTSGGYVIVAFNPNASIYAGNWSWFGATSGGIANGTSNTLVYGGLNVTFTSAVLNPNASYNQTSSAFIEANLTSVGGPESRDQINASYLAAGTSRITNTSGQNGNVSLAYNGSTWNATHTFSSLFGVGTWNSSVNVSANYFFTNTTNRTFTLYGFMNVTSNSTVPSTVYVYQNATTSCNVSDQLSNYSVNGASVGFYRNGVFLGTNTTNATGYTQITYNVNVSGTYTITCNVSDQPGIFYYRGAQPERNSTLVVLPFPVMPVSPANGTVVDRDGYDALDPDFVLLNVSVPSFVPDNVSVNFTANLTTPGGIAGTTTVFLGSNTTLSGYAILWYNPSSATYAGNWTWWAENGSGSENATLIYTSKGALNVSYNTSVKPNNAYNETDTAIINANATSQGPETRDELNSTYTITLTNTIRNQSANAIATALAYQNPYWNGSQALSTLFGPGNWTTNVNGSGSFWYSNWSTRAITLYGFMNVTGNGTNPSSIFSYQNTTTMCNISDQLSGFAVNGANVTFYRNGTFIGSNATNASGTSQLSYQTNVTGTWTITCNVSDQPNIYYYRGAQPEQNNTLIVTPYPITMTSPANATRIDRDGTSAADADTAVVSASVPSYVPDGVMISFWANLTAPAGILPAQTGLFVGNNTTASGVATFTWDPNSTFYAGNYTLFGNASNAITNATRNTLVIGSLQAVFTNATLYPNASYNESDTAVLDANLTSVGPENRSAINTTYGAALQFNLTTPANLSALSAGSFTDPIWNSTYAFATLGGVGNWTIYPLASASYFYGVNGTARNTTVYRIVNATNMSLNPSTIYAYGTTNASCAVINGLLGTPISGYSVQFIRNGTNVANATTDATGYASASIQTNVTGVYTVTCAVFDNLTAFSYARQNESNATLTVTPYPITPVGPTNGTVIDRDSASPIDPDFAYLNASLPAGVPDGITVTFQVNLTSPNGITPLQANISAGTNTTLGGAVGVWWNPSGAFYAGNYTWWASETQASTNGTRDVLVMGSVNAAYADATIEPPANATQNGTIVVSVNLTTPGPENASALNVSYFASTNATHRNASASSAVGLVFNGSQWRNTTFTPLTTPGVGLHNVTVSAGGRYLYPSANVTRNVTVYGYMNATNATMTTNAVFAFEYATAYCDVKDEHTQADVSGANVTVTRNGTVVGTNLTNATGRAIVSFATSIPGVYNITCSVANQTAIYYYAGDSPNVTTNLTVVPFPITPLSPANDTIVDRDSASVVDPDAIPLILGVPSYVPDGADVQFLANLTSPAGITPAQIDVLLGDNTTLSNNVTLWWNPDSTIYTGNWSWYGRNGTSASTNGTRTALVYGGLSIVYRASVRPNASYNQTDTALFDVNVTAPGGPENTSALNASYTAVIGNRINNASNIGVTTTLAYVNPYWNGSSALNTLFGVGTWNSTANVSANYFYTNSTNRTFTLYGFMNVTSNTTAPGSIFAFQSATTSCGVQDQLSNYTVVGASVAFYRNGTFLGSNTTDASGNTQITYSVNASGTWTITCNVTDQPGIYYYRGSQPERNSTLIVLPFPITPTAPTNDTALDRDSTNATLPDSAVFTFSVPPYVPDGVMVEFRANLTMPSTITPAQTAVLFGNSTTNAGVVSITFDPNASIYAGNWSWYGISPQGSGNGSRTTLVYGSLALVFNDSLTAPDVNYTENQTATARFNLTSLGPENRSSIASDYGANVFANATSPYNLAVIGNGASFTDPAWNTTLRFLATPLGGAGVWNVTGNASAQWFIANGTLSVRNTTVYGYANVTNITLTPNPVDAYNFQTVSCNVSNEYTNLPVNGMNVTFWQAGVFKGSNLTDASGITRLTYTQPVQGLFTVTCNISDMPSIYYLAGDVRNMSAVANVTPILFTPANPANGTQVDRDEIGFGSNTIALNGTMLAGVPDGVPVDFWANLSDPVIGGQHDLYLGNATTNTSNVTLVFNPNSSWYAGTYTWWMNNTGGLPNGTRTFVIMGAVNFTNRDALIDPRAVYNDSYLVNITVNATSNGPESVSMLNATYGMNTTITLIDPVLTNHTQTAYYNGSSWNTTFDLFAQTGGVWNVTGAPNATYFYPANYPLRNFTLYAFTNLTVFDVEEMLNMSAFANSPTMFYANYSNLTNQTVTGATCIIALYDRNVTMLLNATSGLYETEQNFSDEGVLNYTVTCTRPFYVTGIASTNVTMRSLVNMTIWKDVLELSAGLRRVRLNVTNWQNYTQRDISVYDLVPFGMNVTWQQTPTVQQNITGNVLRGLAVQWFIPNMTAGQSTLLNYTIAGTNNISNAFIAGVTASATNKTVVFAP